MSINVLTQTVMKKSCLIFFLLVFLFQLNFLVAQNHVVGRVVDEGDVPIAGALVQVAGTTQAVLSDVNGGFDLVVPVGRARLEVSYLGLKTEVVSVDFSDGENVDVGSVQLEPNGLEKSITGIQVGTGLKLYNERRLTDRLVFRSQVDFSPVFLQNTSALEYYDQNGSPDGFVWVDNLMVLPQNFSMELRSYLNIGFRQERRYNVRGNSADYLALSVKYAPVYIGVYQSRIMAELPSVSGVAYGNQAMVVSMASVGMRRSFSRNYNFELKAGIGVNLSDFSSAPVAFDEFSADWDTIEFFALEGVVFQFEICVGYDFRIRN